MRELCGVKPSARWEAHFHLLSCPHVGIAAEAGRRGATVTTVAATVCVGHRAGESLPVADAARRTAGTTAHNRVMGGTMMGGSMAAVVVAAAAIVVEEVTRLEVVDGEDMAEDAGSVPHHRPISTESSTCSLAAVAVPCTGARARCRTSRAFNAAVYR